MSINGTLYPNGTDSTDSIWQTKTPFILTVITLSCQLFLFPFYAFIFIKNGKKEKHHLHEIISIVLILSALLYIPMFISVRKQSSLMSARMNKPHKFIIWQTIAVCIGKIFFLFPIYLHYGGNLPEHDYQVLLTDIDLMLIPLIIQVVYLGSTKQNLDSLNLNIRNLFRSKINQVQPYFIRDAVSSTQAAPAPAI
ncbi:hypothetical protein GCK72_008044 [Caenorhabditis remanei]|uniref:Serpentine receptor class gamma n=1 Tax=Caenorhabditis remanei TaxID=31234 RepID=A0A6A5HP13_CAERE|nr:hypothetical protein GCK72_008044 [Caenorhabditis remanei]KAF1768083.1 hypothetical protein GCK72_008044 [Caenorhabditis remanei]